MTLELDGLHVDAARGLIAQVVDSRGPLAAPDLRARLLDADLALVPDIARALRELGDRESVELAVGALASDRYPVRLAGAMALAVFREQRAAAPLLQALADPIAAVRAAALRALWQLDLEAAAIDRCAALLHDVDPQVRGAAVRVVARAGQRAGALLDTLRAEPDELVRIELARQLGLLSDEHAAALCHDPAMAVRLAAARTASGRPDLVAGLLAHDPYVDVRRAAAAALGRTDDEVGVLALLTGLRDHDSVVRATCLQALGRALGHDRAVERLLGECRAADPARRAAGLYALAQLAPSGLDDAVIGALAEDPDPDVRMALVSSAAALLTDSKPLLTYMAGDADSAVRAAAGTRLVALTGEA